jgi:hypothetical protein
VKRKEEAYSLYMPGTKLEEVQAFLKALNGAVTLDGKKWAISMRYPFPGEKTWHKAFSEITKWWGGPADVSGKNEAERISNDSRDALTICRSLPDYQSLHNSFEIEDATLGFINFLPESLFVRLRSTKPRTIDAAWWWNPLSDKKPSLAWQDFLTAFAKAEHAMAKHPWLGKLKSLPGERSLELHLLGMQIGEPKSDLDTFVLPPWRHAGMAGRPAYCLLARRGEHSWIEFLFSDEDDRAFVCSTQNSAPDSQSELDRLDVFWHPRGKRGESSSRYAMVDREGHVQVQTFVADER